jgi:general secretion pathway protein J
MPMLRNAKGFTLLEIMVALFVFTILAMIMTHALHSVLGVEKSTNEHAARLAEMQMALLFLEHDLEQAVDRPILNREGMQEVAFIGDNQHIEFTHGGLANPDGRLVSSTLQRTKFINSENHLQRQSYEVLDQVADSKPDIRLLINNVSELKFEFLDSKGIYRNAWPAANDTKADVMPVAVKISFVVAHWGKMIQVFVIPGKSFVTA